MRAGRPRLLTLLTTRLTLLRASLRTFLPRDHTIRRRWLRTVTRVPALVLLQHRHPARQPGVLHRQRLDHPHQPGDLRNQPLNTPNSIHSNSITYIARKVVDGLNSYDDWLSYARRSRLPPFVRLAATIARYRPSIEATIEYKLTNGIAESNNAQIGRLRNAARGFHTAKAFITMIMLDRAGIAPTLPWAK